jgi:hypothetical protein
MLDFTQLRHADRGQSYHQHEEDREPGRQPDPYFAVPEFHHEHPCDIPVPILRHRAAAQVKVATGRSRAHARDHPAVPVYGL